MLITKFIARSNEVNPLRSDIIASVLYINVLYHPIHHGVTLRVSMPIKTLLTALLLITGCGFIASQLSAELDTIKALCLLWIVAVLWLSEVFHVTITALCIPVLGTLLGITDLPTALDNFSHPIIFVFLGGFALAAALRAQQLDRYLAEQIVKLANGRMDRAALLLCFATAALSMWISNTATIVVALPLMLGLTQQLSHLEHPRATQTFCLLGIAYSANLGGITTLVGSAPNGIAAASIHFSFIEWLSIGGPLFLLLWPLVIALLWWHFKPQLNTTVVMNDHDHAFEWTPKRILLLCIFCAAVMGWLFSQPLGGLLGIDKRMNAWVALSALLLLVMTRVVSWKEIERTTDWGVLLLFGGGLALSGLLKSSGGSQFLGNALADSMQWLPPIGIVCLLVGFVVVLTELTSNTATTALLVPIFVALPESLISDVHAALAVGISASCAFMLPVATPPNAVVHATGMITQKDMMSVGGKLNLLCLIIISAVLWVLF